MNLKTKLFSLILALSVLLGGCAQTLPAPAETVAQDESLTVSFLDVGQVVCALLECGGEFLLIDGGNRDDSQLVVSYLEQQGVQELAAVVCTHAHEDHVGGLPAVLAVYPTKAVYAPTRTYASKIFDKFVYYTDQQGLEITIPAPGDGFSLGDAQVTVLGPVKSYAEPNNTSIVLRIAFGSNVFLFTGDMETEAEDDMLDYWGDKMDWKADVLKVGHHCSKHLHRLPLSQRSHAGLRRDQPGQGQFLRPSPRGAFVPAPAGGSGDSAHRRAWHHSGGVRREDRRLHLGESVGNPRKHRVGSPHGVYWQQKFQEIPFPGLRQPALPKKCRGIFLLPGGHRRGLHPLLQLPEMSRWLCWQRDAAGRGNSGKQRAICANCALPP